jgi:hypothetical protein
MVDPIITCPRCKNPITGKPEREFTAHGDAHGRFNAPRQVKVYFCNSCHRKVSLYQNPPIEKIADILVKKHPYMTKEEVTTMADNPGSLLKSATCPACDTVTQFSPWDLFVRCNKCAARLRHVVVRQKTR